VPHLVPHLVNVHKIKIMSIIGIDYSLRSPAVTVLDNDELKYFVFPRVGTLKDKFIETLQLSNVNVSITDDFNHVKDLSINERLNSVDAEYLATTVCNTIKQYVNSESLIAIEGISFASPGNTKVQYSGYHYIFRLIAKQIFNISYEQIYTFAPNAVKKVAGKGNYKKDEMIAAFCNSESQLLKNCKLQYGLKNTPELYQSPKAKHWNKPVDDIIDSFWTMKAIYNAKH
jgi:hypothetical protein